MTPLTFSLDPRHPGPLKIIENSIQLRFVRNSLDLGAWGHQQIMEHDLYDFPKGFNGSRCQRSSKNEKN